MLTRSVLLAMCLGCHGNCCSWYSAALIIFMLDYKVFMYDYLCQILFTVLDFYESYEAQCACPIFETQCRNTKYYFSQALTTTTPHHWSILITNFFMTPLNWQTHTSKVVSLMATSNRGQLATSRPDKPPGASKRACETTTGCRS